MTDFAVRAVMTGDNTGLVGAARGSTVEIDKLGAAARTASGGAKELASAQGTATSALMGTTRESLQLERSLLMLSRGMGYQVLQVRDFTVGLTRLVENIGVTRIAIGALAAGVGYAASQTGLFQVAWENTEKGVVNVWHRLGEEWRKLDHAILSNPALLQALGLITPGAAVALTNSLNAQAAAKLPFAPSKADMAGIAANTAQTVWTNTTDIYGFYGKTDADAKAAKAAADEWAAQQAARNRQTMGFEDSFLRSWKMGDANTAPGNAYDALNPNHPNPGWTQDQRIADEQATTDSILKIAKEANDRQQAMANELADSVVRAHVYMADSIRGSFDQMGASVILDFKNAGQAAMGFVKQLANIYLQEQVMEPLSKSLFGPAGSTLGGSIGGALADFLGFGGFPDSVAITPGLFPIAHSGGLVGLDGLASRYIHPAVFDDAPRFHVGGLLPGERPIVARDGEGVFTPKQMDNADALLNAAVNSPKVIVNVYEAPGTKATVNQSQGADGGIAIDVMIEQLDSAFADRQARGKSQFGRSMENSYNLRRTPS
jgi:hypothetical protein